MTPISFTDASNTFSELLGDLDTYWGAEYAHSDSYHDLFLTLGECAGNHLILAITIETENAMEPERHYFEGVVRLLGRPVGEDDAFSADYGMDRMGVYQLTGSTRIPVQLTAWHAQAFADATQLSPSRLVEHILTIDRHFQQCIRQLAIQSGAPLVWQWK